MSTGWPTGSGSGTPCTFWLRPRRLSHGRAVRGRTRYRPDNDIPAMRAAIRREPAKTTGITLPDERILPDRMGAEVAESVRLAGGVAAGVPLRVAEGYGYDPVAIARPRRCARARRTRSARAPFRVA